MNQIIGLLLTAIRAMHLQILLFGRDYYLRRWKYYLSGWDCKECKYEKWQIGCKILVYCLLTIFFINAHVYVLYISGQTGSKRAKNSLFGLYWGLVAPNWWNKVEQGWNKSWHMRGDELEQGTGPKRVILLP